MRRYENAVAQPIAVLSDFAAVLYPPAGAAPWADWGADWDEFRDEGVQAVNAGAPADYAFAPPQPQPQQQQQQAFAVGGW